MGSSFQIVFSYDSSLSLEGWLYLWVEERIACPSKFGKAPSVRAKTQEFCSGFDMSDSLLESSGSRSGLNTEKQRSLTAGRTVMEAGKEGPDVTVPYVTVS